MRTKEFAIGDDPVIQRRTIKERPPLEGKHWTPLDTYPAWTEDIKRVEVWQSKPPYELWYAIVTKPGFHYKQSRAWPEQVALAKNRRHYIGATHRIVFVVVDEDYYCVDICELGDFPQFTEAHRNRGNPDFFITQADWIPAVRGGK